MEHTPSDVFGIRREAESKIRNPFNVKSETSAEVKINRRKPSKPEILTTCFTSQAGLRLGAQKGGERRHSIATTQLEAEKMQTAKLSQAFRSI